MKISLIHPSRSRPEQAFETFNKWIQRVSFTNSIEYILSLDTSDPVRNNYCNDQDKYFLSRRLAYIGSTTQVIKNDNSNAVQAINEAAKIATGDILIVVSDDFDCPDNWDELIVKATEGKKDWILKTNDGIQKWIITLPIMDREYYNRFNYIYYPRYEHMFCDTELTCVADLIGRKIESDIVFTHNHYSTGRFKQDEVSKKADSTWAHGEELFLERYKKNFYLTDFTGEITSEEYLNWINKKLK